MISPLLGQPMADHARIEQLEKQVEELRHAVYGDITADVPAIRAAIRETNQRLNRLQITSYVTIAVIVTYIIMQIATINL